MDTMGEQEYVTEHDCRERTDKILLVVNDIQKRLFTDNGHLSFQSILTAHTKAIKSFEKKTVAPKTAKEAFFIMSVKAPYAFALIVVSCVWAPNARKIIAKALEWATGV